MMDDVNGQVKLAKMCMFGEGEKHKIHLDFIWEFPGNPVVDSVLPLQGAQVAPWSGN